MRRGQAYVNGRPAGWLAPATRNAPDRVEFDAELHAGDNEIAIWFEDLTERDAVVRIAVNWLSGPVARASRSFDADDDTVAGIARAIGAMHLDAKRYDGGAIHADPAASLCPGHGRRGPASAAISCPMTISCCGEDIQAGADRVGIALAADLPADYRYF